MGLEKKTKIKKMKKRNISPSNIQNDDDEKEQKPKKKKSKNKLHPNKKMRAMRRRTAPKSDLAAIRKTNNIKPSIAKKSKRKSHSKSGSKKKSKPLKTEKSKTLDVKKKRKYKKAQSDALNKINKSNRQRSKKKEEHRQRAQTMHPTMDYNEVINDKQKYIKYIDSKHYFYHQQFAENAKKLNSKDVINRIRKRSEISPPPQMVSCFSAKSRLNQKKKRPLPSAPNMYTIKVRVRPMGFYIETKHLNVITENEKKEQLEVVDNKNKFDKV